MPEVSVIIPAFNSAKSLGRAIDSVLSQTCEGYEIIVIDDGSTDDTGKVVEKYGEKAAYYFQTNRGASAARNMGIAKAHGEYISFLDSDDFYKKDNLGKKVSFLKSNPDIGWVYSDCQYLDEDGNYTESASSRHKYSNRKISGNIFKELLYRRNFIATDAVTVKKSILEDLGGFDENIFSLEDYDLCLRISSKYPVHYIDEVLVYAVERPDSLSNDFTKWVQGNALIADKIEKIIPSDITIEKKYLNRMYADKYNFFVQDFIQRGLTGRAVKSCIKSIRHLPSQKRVYWQLLLLLFQYFHIFPKKKNGRNNGDANNNPEYKG